MSARRAKGAVTSRRQHGPARAKANGAGRWTPARLMAEAERAREAAYAPYSRFRVGAALLARDGRVFHGCNVENGSFGMSVCAERNAVFRAVGDGVRDFVAMAVTAGTSGGASPCGACRQVMHEFAPHMRVYWRDGGGRIVQRRLDTLLALAFDFRPKERK